MKSAIINQFQNSLKMLEEFIHKCPDSLWDSGKYQDKCWHICYHVLFHVNLYLCHNIEEHIPWQHHIHTYQFLRNVPWPPHDEVIIKKKYSKDQIMEYYIFTRDTIPKKINEQNLSDDVGFEWMDKTKYELNLYNLRHLDFHNGQLIDRLYNNNKIQIDWYG